MHYGKPPERKVQCPPTPGELTKRVYPLTIDVIIKTIGVSLLCAKLYNRFLIERLRRALQSQPRATHTEFRKLRSTSQHALSLRRIFESTRLAKNTKYVAMKILRAIYQTIIELLNIFNLE